eukprot:gene15726-biopygen17203
MQTTGVKRQTPNIRQSHETFSLQPHLSNASRPRGAGSPLWVATPPAVTRPGGKTSVRIDLDNYTWKPAMSARFPMQGPGETQVACV